MKGGKGGRKRRPAGGGAAKSKPGWRGSPPKKGAKGPWSDAPKRGEGNKTFGGRPSAAED